MAHVRAEARTPRFICTCVTFIGHRDSVNAEAIRHAIRAVWTASIENKITTRVIIRFEIPVGIVTIALALDTDQ